MKSPRLNQGGFTLIEILVVIGIIAILATIVLIAINPARQFAQARDSQRDSNVNAILNAFGQYIADNKGDEPAGLTVAEQDANVWCDDLVPLYLPALPTDPNSGADGEPTESADCPGPDTDYMVSQDAGRITVSAPNTEERPAAITVTR